MSLCCATATTAADKTPEATFISAKNFFWGVHDGEAKLFDDSGFDDKLNDNKRENAEGYGYGQSG